MMTPEMNDAERQSQEKIAGRRMLAVTEEELQRIVLDIHDGAVQRIFAALSQVNSPAAADLTRVLPRVC